MKKYPLITVAMITYNSGPYLKKSVLSVLNQTYPNLELLVINDASTDNTLDILAAISQKHPRGKSLRVISHKTNLGTGSARNTAIEAARGEYFYFLDSDDFIELGTIKLLYDTISRTGDQFVCASFDKIRPDGSIIKPYTMHKSRFTGRYAVSRWLEQSHHTFGLNQYIIIYLWNKLYRLDYLHRYNIRCLPGVQYEDSWFTYQVYINATSFSVLPDLTYHYIVRDSSCSSVTTLYQERTINNLMVAINTVAADLEKRLQNGEKIPTPIFDTFAHICFYMDSQRYLLSHLPAETKERWLENIRALARTSFKPQNFHCLYGKIIMASLHWPLSAQQWLTLYQMWARTCRVKNLYQKLKLYGSPDLDIYTVKGNLLALKNFTSRWK